MKAPLQLVGLHAAERAAYQTYRDSHWRVKGTNYYGNHLLLQRLYTETEPMIDALGERITGLYGPDWLDEKSHLKLVAEYAEVWQNTDPMTSAFHAATKVHEDIKAAYKALKKRKELTLGTDDLLMAQQNTVETHIYLLQQAMGMEPTKIYAKRLKTKLLR
jgi:DNA-binding ferritin-like protein